MTSKDFSLATELSQLKAAAGDIQTVSEVVLYERQARDHGWWDQMSASYWPDGNVSLQWYDGEPAGFITGSQRMHDAGSRPLHHMYAPVAHVNGTRAHVEAGAETWSQGEINGISCNFDAHVRLNYRLERRGEEWRILKFNAIYEYSSVSPVVPGVSISIPAEELAGFRSSYAIFAWYMTNQGLAADQNQLGIDRPEELDKFYADLKEWLNA
ncbi:nuclear transport factor 2 family protein [Glaciihabitans sp. INWT7]|uniref:nuclear transport factor 2 family protein n=1 Tax=Glaciihabitans sp. INWT7 TaxID=2596912 RepID=UPI0016280104|nr:nuclear transport factor 2 family protein [Glaciihabitans sp. INWT7]